MRYRKKPVIVEASQWFKAGDHPKVIPPANNLRTSDFRICTSCKKSDIRDHHIIDTLEGTMRVCEGDYIITGVNGEHYACKPDIFEKTYEKVEE